MSRTQTEARRPAAAPEAGPPEGWRTATLHRPADIDAAIAPVLEAMLAAGYGAREAFGVRLALEEALVNGLRHGNRGDRSKRVRLRHRVADDCVLAEVQDEGPGFRPEDVPDPLAEENRGRDGGRGLFLIRHYMTWVRHNPPGNCVLMCKRRGEG